MSDNLISNVLSKSSFYSKRSIVAGRFKIYLFDVLDRSVGRAGCQIVLECFDALRYAFGQRLDTPVRQITHVALNLMARGGALREEAIADALHFPANQKFSRDFHQHP